MFFRSPPCACRARPWHQSRPASRNARKYLRLKRAGPKPRPMPAPDSVKESLYDDRGFPNRSEISPKRKAANVSSRPSLYKKDSFIIYIMDSRCSTASLYLFRGSGFICGFVSCTSYFPGVIEYNGFPRWDDTIATE